MPQPTYQELLEANPRFRAENARLRADNQRLTRRVAELEAQVDRLTAQVQQALRVMTRRRALGTGG